MNLKEEFKKKFNITMNYDEHSHVKEVIRDGIVIEIHSDKHPYICMKCGCIFQSKNIEARSLFDTNDPKRQRCNEEHTGEDLLMIPICECVIVVW